MTNLYKYFLTSEIICLDELPNITDIFLKTKNPQTKSILEKRKHEIDDFLDKKKKDKLELFDIKYYIFKDITELYNDLINIKINIKEFCIKLIFFLYSTKENISTIEKYLEINTIYPVLKNPFEYNSLSYLKSITIYLSLILSPNSLSSDKLSARNISGLDVIFTFTLFLGICILQSRSLLVILLLNTFNEI